MDSVFDFNNFLRAYLALFFTGVALFYTARIILKTGHDKVEVVFPGHPLSVTWWAHGLFRFFRAVIWLVFLIRWPFPSLDNYIVLFDKLTIFELNLFGAFLLTAGFTLAIYGHIGLGHQWRSGIDPGGPSQLKTNGVFGLSRNPMFLGVLLAQTGLFIALPSVFTLICLLVGWIAIHMQLKAEERHLAEKFPEAYSDYCSKVPRWL